MRWALFLLCCLSLTACARGRRHRTRPGIWAATPAGSVIQPRLGSDREPARVTFEIDAVYEQQELTKASPWHAAGGDWTFFDARAANGAHFGFGWRGKRTAGGFSFGKALWTVPDPEAGASLMGSFAQAFHGVLPPPADKSALSPQTFGVALLGQDLGRSDDGQYSGNGDWFTSKLFLQRRGIEAEVFFNFTLKDKRGEFSEKSRDDANDVLRFMARELRDGPPPPLTPQNDPRITLVGPKFDAFRTIGPNGARFVRFEAKGARLTYKVRDGNGTRLVSTALEGDPNEEELLRVEHELEGVACAKRNDALCLIEQSTPEKKGVLSSADPRSFLWLERVARRSTPLRGPWGEHASMAAAAISPDGKLLALEAWREEPNGKMSTRAVYFVSTAALDHPVAFAREHERSEAVGWLGTGATAKAIVQSGANWDKDETLRFFEVDPASGAATEIPKPKTGLSYQGNLSPDGRHEYSCDGDHDLLIRDVRSGRERRFVIAPRERFAFAHGCDVEWHGSRYLTYDAERPGFLDIDSMKLSFPFDENDALQYLLYDPTFSWALSLENEQMRVARVVIR